MSKSRKIFYLSGAVLTIGAGLFLWFLSQKNIPIPTQPGSVEISRPAEPESDAALPTQDTRSFTPELDKPQAAGGSTIVQFSNEDSKQQFLTANDVAQSDLAPTAAGAFVVNKPAGQLQLPEGSQASPNLSYFITTTPNDSRYSQQWHLPKISAPSVWDITTGSSSVTIAVIDTGFSLNHEDLADRWANNSGEVGATVALGPAPNCVTTGLPPDKSCNNLDDDGNGKVDDWRGWDFICDNNSPAVADGDCDNNPNGDGVNHGTLTSGAAAAAGNNGVGVAGVDWQAKILPLQALADSGGGTTDGVAEAVDYAVSRGAKVISMSLGSTDVDNFLRQRIDAAIAAGVVVVAAAGNCGDPQTYFFNGCDSVGQMLDPANYPPVIAVGASNQGDDRSSFSSYGANLDIMAPGSGIVTTSWSSGSPTTAYASASGTSLATPVVSGSVSLLFSVRSNLSVSQITTALNGATDKVSQMSGANYTNQHGYGRLNTLKLTNLSAFTCPNNISPNGNIPSTPSGPKVLSNRYSIDSPDRLSLSVLNNTGTACIEIHTWNPGYQSWLTNIASNHPAIDPADGEIISGNIYGDSKSELIFVKYRNTGSGRIEVHTWDTTYQHWVSNIASNHPAIDPADGRVIAADTNGDGADELIFVKYRNTGSGRIEIHTWAAGQQSWISNIATNHGEVSPDNAGVVGGNLYGDGKDELVFVKYRSNGSGLVEVHTWAPGYQSWITNIATNHGEVNPVDTDVISGDTNGDGRDGLIFIKYRNNGSGRIEVHTWASGQQSWTSNIATNHPAVDP